MGTIDPDSDQYLQVAVLMAGLSTPNPVGLVRNFVPGCQLRSSGYPGWLALFLKLSPIDNIVATIASAHLGLWVLATLLLAAGLYRPLKVQWAAAYILLIGWVMFPIQMLLASEWNIFCLLILLLTCTEAILERPRLGWFMGLGSIVGLLFVTRREYALFSVCFFLALCWLRSAPVKVRELAIALIFGVAMIESFDLWKTAACGTSSSSLQFGMSLWASVSEIPYPTTDTSITQKIPALDTLSKALGGDLNPLTDGLRLATDFHLSYAEIASEFSRGALIKFASNPELFMQIVVDRFLNALPWLLGPALIYGWRLRVKFVLTSRDFVLEAGLLGMAAHLLFLSVVNVYKDRYFIPLSMALILWVLVRDRTSPPRVMISGNGFGRSKKTGTD